MLAARRIGVRYAQNRVFGLEYTLDLTCAMCFYVAMKKNISNKSFHNLQTIKHRPAVFKNVAIKKNVPKSNHIQTNYKRKVCSVLIKLQAFNLY